MSQSVEAIKKLVKNISFPAWILDEKQVIFYMNPVMQEIFGDLAGEKESILYDTGNSGTVNLPEIEMPGLSEVIVADVPFHRLQCEVDLGEEGVFCMEIFKDISEQKLNLIKMKQALQKMNAETKMAQTIQSGLLPIDDTYWNTVSYSSLYKPADDLGGDFYDLIKLNDDEFLLYIADVSGHGIQAALLAIFMRERVRIHAEAALAGTTNLLSKLVQDFTALDIDSGTYITMVLCKYTKSERTLAIANAGHGCFPLVIRNNGRTESVPTRGIPICMIAGGEDYVEEIVSMNPGDRLVLFTDGIIEEVDSTTGQSFGAEGVRKLAEKYHEYNGGYLARMIMDESAHYALVNAKDDRTIIVADILS